MFFLLRGGCLYVLVLFENRDNLPRLRRSGEKSLVESGVKHGYGDLGSAPETVVVLRPMGVEGGGHDMLVSSGEMSRVRLGVILIPSFPC